MVISQGTTLWNMDTANVMTGNKVVFNEPMVSILGVFSFKNSRRLCVGTLMGAYGALVEAKHRKNLGKLEMFGTFLKRLGPGRC